VRTREQIVAAIRAIADEVRQLDGPDSIVPGGLEAHADLFALGPSYQAGLLEALTEEWRWSS